MENISKKLKVVTEDERQIYFIDILFLGEDCFEYTIFLDETFTDA